MLISLLNYFRRFFITTHSRKLNYELLIMLHELFFNIVLLKECINICPVNVKKLLVEHAIGINRVYFDLCNFRCNPSNYTARVVHVVTNSTTAISK